MHEDVSPIFKMVVFQPAMLVYQRVAVFTKHSSRITSIDRVHWPSSPCGAHGKIPGPIRLYNTGESLQNVNPKWKAGKSLILVACHPFFEFETFVFPGVEDVCFAISAFVYGFFSFVWYVIHGNRRFPIARSWGLNTSLGWGFKLRFDQSYAYGEKEDEFKLLCKHARNLNDWHFLFPKLPKMQKTHISHDPFVRMVCQHRCQKSPALHLQILRKHFLSRIFVKDHLVHLVVPLGSSFQKDPLGSSYEVNHFGRGVPP